MSEVKNENLSEKLCLTVTEASRYSGIGISRIRELLKQPDCTFLLQVGRKQMIKRELFEEYIRTHQEV